LREQNEQPKFGEQHRITRVSNSAATAVSLLYDALAIAKDSQRLFQARRQSVLFDVNIISDWMNEALHFGILLNRKRQFSQRGATGKPLN
jgi:hypothetical protein